MSDFKLSNGLNKNKVFLVRRSEIEGRLDPNFYTDIYRENEIKINNSPFETKSLSEITLTISDGTHFTPQYQSNGIKFISVKDVRKSRLDLDHPVYISIEEADKLDKRCIPQKNDILLTKIGATYGYAAVIDSDERFQIFVSLALIRPNYKLVNPYYLEICLNSNFSYLQFQRNLKGAGVPDLHLEEIRKLKLPVPSLDVQKKIVEKYSFALKKSREKQFHSKSLLESIDTYLLNELGIVLPQKDDSLKARIFTTKFSAVCGNRLDPFYVKNESNKMKSKSFEEIALGDMAVIEKGQTITSDEIIEGSFPVIAGGQTSPYNHNTYNYKGNCITISASGAYAGYVWYHETPIFASDCMVVYSNDEEKMSTLFLSEILKLKQSEIYDMQQGAGQPHVYAKDIYSIQIPLPPLSKQIEIADHIKQIRQQAKQLEIEAEQILTDAKKEIEKMILGEEKWY